MDYRLLEKDIEKLIEKLDPYDQIELLFNVKSRIDNKLVVSLQKQAAEAQIKTLMTIVNNFLK